MMRSPRDGPSPSSGVGARGAGRCAYPGGMRALRPQHRELHRHGEGTGRPGRAAARQRPLRARRLLRPAGHHRSRAGRLLQPRRRSSPRPAAAPPWCSTKASRAPRASPSTRWPMPAMFVAWAGPTSRNSTVAAGDHPLRQADRPAAHRRGQPRLPRLRVHTGDASGQNMVTIATEAICRHIVERSPVQPRYCFVEANMSGDKKATTQSFLTVRGRKVRAEVDAAGRRWSRAAAHDAARDGRLLADVRDRRRAERHDRRAGPLRQRPGGALHRLRAGRGVRGRVGRRRDPLRAARRRRPLRASPCRT